MRTYDELKSELLEIAKVVERFPEQVKAQVYDLLVGEYCGNRSPQPVGKTARTEDPAAPKESQPKPDRTARVPGSRKPPRESYSIDRNLNLRGGNGTPSFKDFYAQKKPKSAMEFNVVAVYYLQHLLQLEKVDLDHAYTCYVEVGKKPPQFFKQSFVDTKNQKGWIDIDANGCLGIPHRGRICVEHDLPKTSTTTQGTE